MKRTLKPLFTFLLVFLLATAGFSGAMQKKIHLNQASAAELEEVPGIGPAIARRIIEYREKNGPFKRIEDLMNVRGIGEKKFLQLKDRVTVGAAPQPKEG